MTNGITNRQMVFILFLTLATYTTINIATQMAQTTGRSSWIPLLMASLLFGAAAVVITKLGMMHQGQVLFDYCGQITGSVLRYVICFYYIIYFLIIGLYLLMRMADFMTENFLPQTPHIVMIAAALLLLAYVAYKGIPTIARLFESNGLLFLVVTVGLCIFMLVQGMPENFMPFFSANEIKFLPEAMKKLIIPFGGIEILFIIPLTSKNKKAPLVGLLTVLAIGLIYILITESTIKILGIYNTSLQSDSLIEAIKLVKFPIIERTDIFYLTFGLMGLFSGLIIIFATIVELACKIIPKLNRTIITASVGSIIFIFFMMLEGINISLYENIVNEIISYLVLISGLLIPGILLTVAKVRNRHRRIVDHDTIR